MILGYLGFEGNPGRSKAAFGPSGAPVDEWPADGVFSEVLLGYLGAIGRGETDEDKTLAAS